MKTNPIYFLNECYSGFEINTHQPAKCGTKSTKAGNTYQPNWWVMIHKLYPPTLVKTSHTLEEKCHVFKIHIHYFL